MDRKLDDVADDGFTSQLKLNQSIAENWLMEMKLSLVLKRLLEERKMTLKELSAATKIKASTLSGWKNGVTPRDLGEVLRCAQFFEISLEKLLFDKANDASILEGLLTEEVFEGYLKVKIERVLRTKSK